MLTVEKLTQSYNRGAIALEDISFAIEPHTFTAILGPSGAGKTTLLRCILQLLRPDQGRDLTTCSAKDLRRTRTQILNIQLH